MEKDESFEVPILDDIGAIPQKQELPKPSDHGYVQQRVTRRSVSFIEPVAREGIQEVNVGFSAPLGQPWQRTEPVFKPQIEPLYIEGMFHASRTNNSRLSRARVSPKEEEPSSNAQNLGTEGGNHGMHAPHATGHKYLRRSGTLGKCNDVFCTTCPAYYETGRQSATTDAYQSKIYPKIQVAVLGNVRNKTSSMFSCLWNRTPGIMSPHSTFIQHWNKFFVISCFVAIFVDPLFFFLLSSKEDDNCIVLNWKLTVVISILRTFTDCCYFLHMLLQFRLAYVAPESRSVGAGDLVDDPKEIARHYLHGYFALDVFVVLPLPQIMMLYVLPAYVGSSANYAKNLLRVTVLLQYIPRIVRFFPLISGSSSTGLIFESAWANFLINISLFMLCSHVIGSCWYLFGLQRVNKCLQDACKNAQDIDYNTCNVFIDCGSGERTFFTDPAWPKWQNNSLAADCFQGTNAKNFSFGIYGTAVAVTVSTDFSLKYIYSFFWGFQQISTLAGNQIPSLFIWEAIFTMAIIALGLLLFALLIGNMQNFLQSLGRRRIEMQLRRRDVELWMARHRLPTTLRRRIRQSERLKWAANQGVNEEEMLEDLPEDLQREVRQHLCLYFVKKVRIFRVMDDQVLDAICDRLRQRLYIDGSVILRRDYPVESMCFIVRGNLVSTGKDSGTVQLSGGDICGEELLTWYLENSAVHKHMRMSKRTGTVALSSRTVRCVGSVEAFILQKNELEELTKLFSRMLRSTRVQGAIRYESHYWRSWAASTIQVYWRYRNKKKIRDATLTKWPTEHGTLLLR